MNLNKMIDRLDQWSNSTGMYIYDNDIKNLNRWLKELKELRKLKINIKKN